LKTSKFVSLYFPYYCHHNNVDDFFKNPNNNNSGAWNAEAIELTQEIGRHTTAVTGDPLETIHLFQRLSIAIQQANAVSFTGTFKSE